MVQILLKLMLILHSLKYIFSYIKHVDDIQNKRSKLFPDRMRVPGRKTKFILTITYLIHLYALMKVLQAKKIYGLKS